jgi:hypothetical protein
VKGTSMSDETRAPRTPDDYLEQIMALLGVTSSVDAYNRVSELVQRQPIVWHDGQGRLSVAPMTVRQIVQVIGALEGLTVK